MSHTARSDRPIRRWISWVRPDCLPLAASRRIRSGDEPGSIEYSAVTQPLPVPRIQRGTSSSTDAVHSTLVRPTVTSTEPAAASVKSRSKVIGRELVGLRGRRVSQGVPLVGWMAIVDRGTVGGLAARRRRCLGEVGARARSG